MCRKVGLLVTAKFYIENLVSAEDLIEIQDVALLEKSQEWTDDVYSLSASVMDGVSNSQCL
jgi:hypothetical protein